MFHLNGGNTKKVDKEKQQRTMSEIVVNYHTTASEGLSSTLKTVCSECMPQKTEVKWDQRMYRWNQEFTVLYCKQNLSIVKICEDP